MANQFHLGILEAFPEVVARTRYLEAMQVRRRLVNVNEVSVLSHDDSKKLNRTDRG